MNNEYKSSGKRLFLLCALVFVPCLQLAYGQPARALSLKVAYAAGGPSDTVARLIQPPLSDSLKQPVIIENAPGASGSIAAISVRNSTDGNSLLVTTVNDLVGAPLASKEIRYKPETFRLVAPILASGVALVTNTTHSFNDIDDFIEKARKRNDVPMTAGTWGHGSATHIISADFVNKSGVKLLFVPYKGAAPVIQALMSNEIDIGFVPISGNLPDLIKTKKIRVIAIAGTARNPFLPGVPTISESKYVKNFSHNLWTGIFAPSNTSEAVIAKVNSGMNDAMKRPEYVRFIQESASLSFEASTPSQADAFYKSELQKMRGISNEIKLEPQ